MNHPSALLNDLSLEERNALTQCYVLCRGFNTIGAAGPLSRLIRAAYPNAGFDILAEAIADMCSGAPGAAASKIERFAERPSARQKELRETARALRRFSGA